MEVIDRRDERSKFIFSTIADTRIALTIDDISDILGHKRDRTKYRPYPEKVEYEYESEPDKVRYEYSLQYGSHKASLRSIISESSKTKYRKSCSFI